MLPNIFVESVVTRLRREVGRPYSYLVAPYNIDILLLSANSRVRNFLKLLNGSHNDHSHGRADLLLR